MNFLIYNVPGEEASVSVIVKNETIWLTQKAMAELFGVGVPAISKHLKNIFEEGELMEEVVISILETTTSSSSSPSSKMLRRCLLMAGVCTPNSSPIARCVSQIVSSLMTALTATFSSADLYIKKLNSFRIAFSLISLLRFAQFRWKAKGQLLRRYASGAETAAQCSVNFIYAAPGCRQGRPALFGITVP